MSTERIKKAFAAILGLVSLATIGLASSVSAADRGGGRSFGVAGGAMRQNRFPGFRDGFLVGGGLGGTQVIIEQSSPGPTVEPAKPANKGRYVPPRWVDGGYGVEILQPGYWTGPQDGAKP